VYKPEIEEVLTRHLGRVHAPEELWERIENPQVSARVPTRHRRVRAVLAVAAMLVVIAVVFHTRRETVEVVYPLPQHKLTLQVSKGGQPADAVNATCLLCHAGG
jgi:hypothetical protein